MEVDPHRVRAFWEVAAADRQAAMKRLGAGKACTPWVLRLYEVAPPGSERAHPPRHFDFSVDLAPGNGYVQVPANDCSYRAELGPVADTGRFEPACSSNAVQVPRSGLSARYNPQWLEMGEDLRAIGRVPEPPPESTLPPRYTAAIPTKAAQPMLSRRAGTPTIRACAEEPVDMVAPGSEYPESEIPAPQEYAQVEIGRAGGLPDSIEDISSFSWNAAGRQSARADRAAEEAPRRSRQSVGHRDPPSPGPPHAGSSRTSPFRAPSGT